MQEQSGLDPERKALFIGRFQPFHKGHLHVIEEIVDKLEYLIIGIGSAKMSYTVKNPFTGGERAMMIRNSLIPSKREKCFIIPIGDINRYNVWVSHVEDLVPPFDLVVGNSKLTALLFSEKGYEIYNPKNYSRETYKGEVIRERMLTGKSWREFVPEGTANLIDNIKGVDRIRTIGT